MGGSSLFRPASPKKKQESLHYTAEHCLVNGGLVVSLYFGGKRHVSNGQNISFKEP